MGGAALVWSLLILACDSEPEMAPPADSGPPNVLVILVDDLRADALSVAGHPLSRTPNIDRLAEEGIYFTDAFVVHSLCAPSRATLLTGRYSHTHGVRTNANPLSKELPTTPVLFEWLGYETAYAGKWHLGGRGNLGFWFDRWLSFFGQGVYENPVLDVDGETVEATGHVTDLITDYAVGFLEQSRTQPFFLTVSHKAVHQPFVPQDRFSGTHSDVSSIIPVTFGEDLSAKPEFVRSRAVPLDTLLLSETISRYFDTLSGVDESVGRLLGALERTGVLDRTLIVFTSDNGYLLGEHRLTDKRVAYEESIRVPIIVRYPEWFPPGLVSDALVTNLDIAPTLLDAAGLTDVPGAFGMDGMSLRTLAKESTTRKAFLYEYFMEPAHPVTPSIRAVRTRDMKYIEYVDTDEIDELYDLASDPLETRNLVDDPAYAGTLEELRAELRRLREATGDTG